LTVLEGQAEIWVEADRYRVTAGQSAIIPAGRKHGFRNTGSGILRVQAILASPVFEAAYDDARETPRRWLPAG
jgi:quercetin dioxygenase-like cupin family protein